MVVEVLGKFVIFLVIIGNEVLKCFYILYFLIVLGFY